MGDVLVHSFAELVQLLPRHPVFAQIWFYEQAFPDGFTGAPKNA